MGAGCDVNQSVVGHVHSLKAAGITWIGRYYGKSKTDPLTYGEAVAICSCDLWIVSVHENGFPTSVDYFTQSQAVLDATTAKTSALHCQQTPQSLIYFTVDYDAAEEDLPQIQSYFSAVRSRLQPTYLTGVYGNGLVCQHLLSVGVAHSAWLAAPTAWAGYDTHTPYAIRQTHNGVTLCGLEVDLDESSGAAGGWQIKKAA